MDLMGVEEHPQSPVLCHQKGMSPGGPPSTPDPIPIPDTGMRAGSKGGSGKGEDRSPERREGGGRSLSSEVQQVLESTACTQFKWCERSSERRGQGWAAAARE